MKINSYSNEITVLKDWVCIDVQTVTPGLNFQEAWEQQETMTFQGKIFYWVPKKDLFSFKKLQAVMLIVKM